MLKPNVAVQIVDHNASYLANFIILAKHSQTEIVHEWPLTLVFFGDQLVD